MGNHNMRFVVVAVGLVVSVWPMWRSLRSGMGERWGNVKYQKVHIYYVLSLRFALKNSHSFDHFGSIWATKTPNEYHLMHQNAWASCELGKKNGNTNTVEKSLSERLLLNAIKNISSIVECYFIIIMIFLFCFFGWFVHYCHFGWLVCVCVTVVIVPLCLLAFRAKPLVFHLFFGCATFHLFLLCVFISFMLVLVFFSIALSLSLTFSSPHSPTVILFRTRIYIFFCL